MKKVLLFIFPLLVFCSLFKTAEADSINKKAHHLKDSILVTAFHTDSVHVEEFIKKNPFGPVVADQIRQFYKTRDYQNAWITEDGLSEHAQIFLNLYDQYRLYSADSSFKNVHLASQLELLQSEGMSIDSLKTYEQLELKLTVFFIHFIKRAYAGKVDPEKFQWHIPRKKIEVARLLNELVLSKDLILDSWLPISEEYKAMRDHVLRLKCIPQEKWTNISLLEGKNIKQGDTSKSVKAIKNRLLLLGDLTIGDTTEIYTNQLLNAVKGFQVRHGLTMDGIIGPNFLEALNMPIQKKIEQMLINMERMRWMPKYEARKRVVVNIPEFRLHVYEGNKDILSMDVVVGKAATRTVIFSDQIKHVVFSPYWNLPQSIVKNEVLPGLESNPNYLIDHNMELRGQRNGLPIIRQKPGPSNALGRVKFIFPNKYSIYLHDTPSKQLFQRTTRAFSHGCIRVEDPSAFAANLLFQKKEWTSKKIKDAMSSNLELWVNLDSPVPVYITYFTSWIDSSGKLNFRKDIYGHDKRLASHLFEH
ncbi:L,D-transpeptidase family protein [Pedobacter endophyticus]|uniref:L,D-transpeptidase family protein n=1 Tax=Pedobacter endophyticus TaxID=2789740 RepID=A0A7U3SQ64_9SPHI|nr:L,D-transpeptidase family protein [Pedobacter endophyticus]QPH38614.1 L,D-transpeptidase family protein [Pedobacter endophyticus]